MSEQKWLPIESNPTVSFNLTFMKIIRQNEVTFEFLNKKHSNMLRFDELILSNSIRDIECKTQELILKSYFFHVSGDESGKALEIPKLLHMNYGRGQEARLCKYQINIS